MDTTPATPGFSFYGLRDALLGDDLARLRAEAAARLAGAGPAAAPWLAEALGDPAASVRDAACRALARSLATRGPLGHEPDASPVAGPALDPSALVVDALATAAIEDPAWTVRRAAVRALAAIAGAAALDALLEALADPFWRVRHAAAQAVVALGTDAPGVRRRALDGAAARAPLAQAALESIRLAWTGEPEPTFTRAPLTDPRRALSGPLADPDPAVVHARLLDLAPAALPAADLTPLLAEAHRPLRSLALRRLRALGSLDAARAAAAWLDQPLVPHAAGAARTLLDGLERRAAPIAAELLAAWSAQPHGAAWAALWAARWDAREHRERVEEVAAHSTGPRHLRRAAILALGDMARRAREAAPRALALALSASDPRVREAAMAALLPLAGGAALVLDARRDADTPLARRLGVEAAAAAANPEVIERALADPDPRVRTAAIALLDRDRALPPDRRREASLDDDPWVREAALDLASADEALADPDPRVRRRAARLLAGARARIDPPLRRAAAARVAEDSDPGVRALAADLTPAAEPEGLAILLRLQHDSDAGVRAAAREPLRRLADRDARLDALLSSAADDGLRIAAYSLLLGGGEPAAARERLDRALAAEPSGAVRGYLAALAPLFGGAAPARACPGPSASTAAATPAAATTTAATPSSSARAEARAAAPPDATPASASIARRPLGASGLACAPLVISGAHEPPYGALATAADAGVDTFFWEPRYRELTRLLRARRWRRLQVVAGSYHAHPLWIARDVDQALLKLRREALDVFLLFWARSPARLAQPAFEALRAMRDAGKVRAIGFSTHDRALACAALDAEPWDVVMTRHNAAHLGAEPTVFRRAAERGAGVFAFSALCYGRMLRPAPDSDAPPPSAADCYRYGLSQPGVSAVIAAPRYAREVLDDLAVLERPRLGLDEQAALRAHGQRVYAASRRFNRLVRQGRERVGLGEALADLEAVEASEPPLAPVEDAP